MANSGWRKFWGGVTKAAGRGMDDSGPPLVHVFPMIGFPPNPVQRLLKYIADSLCCHTGHLGPQWSLQCQKHIYPLLFPSFVHQNDLI